MKALCLLSENPCPPRNGITIPTYNHLKILKDLGYDLNVLILEEVNDELKLLANARKINLEYSSKIERVLDEIRFKKAYYDNVFNFSQLTVEELNVDVIYYSPISFGYVVSLLLEHIQKITGSKPRVIASISDCYTSVLRTSLSTTKGFSFKPVVSFFRSYLISHHEAKALSCADSILVQTQKDKDWLLKIGVDKNKVYVTPNGVSESLFNVSVRNYTDLVFVGNFRSNYYIDKLDWFVNNVFSDVRKRFNNCTLHVYTSGVRNSRLESIVNCDGVIVHYDFVDDISDVYRDKFVCVAPIFKSYGFINKVAEALGAGLVVVGDSSAFNGMDVQSGIEAFIVESDLEFYNKLCELLESKDKFDFIRMNARKYAMKNFSWQSRKELLNNATKKRQGFFKLPAC